jgi:hypothetical protein
MGKLDDGYSTTISLGGSSLYEKEVTPPGIDGGGGIDTSTMRNTAWRTQTPMSLKTLTNASFTAAYDPAAYTSLLSAVNVNQEITVTFPDGATLVFWGWLNTFTPNPLVEGEQPTAECEIIPSNQNDQGAEADPVFTAA